MSLWPPALRSPVVIAIALILLAAVLWGAWIFLRAGGGDHDVRKNPSNVTEQVNDAPQRDVWQI